jgi:hypothetical protein
MINSSRSETTPPEVGNAAGGVRGKAPALECDDREVLGTSPPSGLGRRTHPCCIAPYHHQSLRHSFLPSESVSGPRLLDHG